VVEKSEEPPPALMQDGRSVHKRMSLHQSSHKGPAIREQGSAVQPDRIGISCRRYHEVLPHVMEHEGVCQVEFLLQHHLLVVPVVLERVVGPCNCDHALVNCGTFLSEVVNLLAAELDGSLERAF